MYLRGAPRALPDTLACVTTVPPQRRDSPRDCLGGETDSAKGSPVPGCLARRMLAPGSAFKEEDLLDVLHD